MFLPPVVRNDRDDDVRPGNLHILQRCFDTARAYILGHFDSTAPQIVMAMLFELGVLSRKRRRFETRSKLQLMRAT